jgi:4-hydroxy-tetrahydrodipicolinate synthase
VIAIKEAGTSLERVRELVALDAVDRARGRGRVDHRRAARGRDGRGGRGRERRARLVADLVHGLRGGDEKRAPARAEKLAPLVTALFAESNPAPLKAALEMMSLCSAELRPPSSRSRRARARACAPRWSERASSRADNEAGAA